MKNNLEKNKNIILKLNNLFIIYPNIMVLSIKNISSYNMSILRKSIKLLSSEIICIKKTLLNIFLLSNNLKYLNKYNITDQIFIFFIKNDAFNIIKNIKNVLNINFKKNISFLYFNNKIYNNYDIHNISNIVNHKTLLLKFLFLLKEISILRFIKILYILKKTKYN